MMLSFLAANEIICALSIFSSQIIILIVTIFCSLFLIGGIPYSLISTLSNNIEITFTNGGATYLVSRIRETILFIQDLQDNKIANPALTKKIKVTFHANKITSWQETYKNQNVNDIISADQKASPSRDTSLDLTLALNSYEN